MKHFSLRLSITLVTFCIGLAVTGIWLFNFNLAKVENSKTEVVCNFPIYEAEQNALEKNEVLGRFKEVSFESLPDCIDESYRFVLMPTFDSPVLIRIWRSADKRFLVVKKLSGKGGFGIGELSSENTRLITENEWLDYKLLLSQSSFWDLPSIDENEPLPNDGAGWKMEGIIGKKTHSVWRQTTNSNFVKSCIYLLKLAHLETEYERYWK